LQPLAWRKPRSIFWNAHGDTFHPNVPDEWIDKTFAVCALTPQHIHMVLTKRPERAREYTIKLFELWHEAGDPFDDRIGTLLVKLSGSPCAIGYWEEKFLLSNVWLGTSVEDQKRPDERIPHLRATPAAVRFLSCEPLIGPVEMDLTGIHWVIVGGEQAHGFRDNGFIENARSIVAQCRAAGVAVFVKQNCGKPGKLPPLPDDLNIKEFPQ
jgi:protein gp37